MKSASPLVMRRARNNATKWHHAVFHSPWPAGQNNSQHSNVHVAIETAAGGVMVPLLFSQHGGAYPVPAAQKTLPTWLPANPMEWITLYWPNLRTRVSRNNASPPCLT